MFLSNGGDYSRDGYYSRKYGNFKYQKNICSFHSMGTIRVTKRKKGALIAMRLKFHKTREKVRKTKKAYKNVGI